MTSAVGMALVWVALTDASTAEYSVARWEGLSVASMGLMSVATKVER